MKADLRTTGIALAPEIAWGTHLCVLYETSRDLLELLTLYVKTGLEQNELCVVMTCEHISRDDLLQALRAAIPDLDRYLERQALKVVGPDELYLRNGRFDREQTLAFWRNALDDALARGFDGLRIN